MRFLSFALFILASIFSATAFADTAVPIAAPVAVPAATPAPAVFTPAQQVAIESIIHDYLIAHPEVLLEAGQALQMKQEQMMQEKATKVIPTVATSLLHDPTSPVLGNPKGTVSVVEFFDYQCPHCKAMEPEIKTLLQQNKNVRFVAKELPIFGADSEFAAKAALAAQRQGKFEAFNAALLNAQGRLPSQTTLDIAKSLGVEVNRLQADMNLPEYTKELEANASLANQLGIAGTPAFIVIAMDPTGKVKSQFIPGQTDATKLAQAVSEVSK